MRAEEPQYHIRLRRGEVGRYVLMPGDPGRVPVIASHLDNPREVAHNREFLTYTGKLDGEDVSVMSTGIGGPSMAIAAEELIAVGADTLIRVGTAGSLVTEVRPGELVVARAAVRDEGTSLGYVPAAYPAVADPDVVAALVEAATAKGQPCRSGIIRSADAFYADVAPETMAYQRYPTDLWAKAHVLASEMEISTLVVVTSIRGVRAGAILAVVNAVEEQVETSKVATISLEPLIETAVEGVRRLIQADSGSRSRIARRKQERPS